jgi:hypothetical protein
VSRKVRLDRQIPLRDVGVPSFEDAENKKLATHSRSKVVDASEVGLLEFA